MVASPLIPYGTRYLMVTCFDRANRQFRGVHEAARLLHQKQGVHHHHWSGRKLGLGRRRTLVWTVVSGHGADGEARISAGSGTQLEPADLALPPESQMFLLGCYQGRESLRTRWAQATGITPEQVHGCSGETDSLLSAVFLLNLVEHGLDRTRHWFRRWAEANHYFRTWFPVARRTYEEQGADFIATLTRFAEEVDVSPYEDFLAVGFKYPSYLSHLRG